MNSNPIATPSACPLCRQTKFERVDQVTGEQLRELWKVMDRVFSAEALSRIAPDDLVILHRCRSCGFEFFNPDLAGGEAFYRDIEKEGYYATSRPEFARTVRFANEKSAIRILDVGCGSGTFLDMAKAAGHDVCGIELNKAAAVKAEKKGHRIFQELLNNLDPTKTGGGFDLITFFQVLEHVSNPVGMMYDALTLLNPKGYISIAVPFAGGIYRMVPYDPYQWPPHHVSRWKISDLKQLASATNTRLAEYGGDVLGGAQIAQFWKMHNRLAPIVNRPKYRGGSAFPEIISFLYRKTGTKYFFPKWGNSIYGYFQKI